MNDARTPPCGPGFLDAPGEVAARLRALDWSATPLGPPEDWPAALKTLTAVMLGAHQPMYVVWGPERSFLYNDAYAPMLGARHPQALGGSFGDAWPELRDESRGLLERAYRGEAIHMDDIALVLRRHGHAEVAHFAFSYTPVRDERGEVAGVFCPLQETTEAVAAAQRQHYSLELEQQLRGLSDPLEIISVAQTALGEQLGASRVGYGEVDSQARYFTTERNWTDGSVPHRSGTHDLEGFGPEIVAALRAGVSLVVHDVEYDPRTNSPAALAAFAAIDTRAALTASLVKNGRMLAAIYVHDRGPRQWSAGDVALVEETAERIWSTVERARAEAQVNQVLESMREAFLLLDRQFRVLRVNAEGQRLDGRPAAEMLGRLFWDLWTDTEETELGRAIKGAMASQEPAALEFPFALSGGRSAWLEVRIYPSAAGLAIFYRDVSHRMATAARQAEIEAELRESEERLRIAQRAGRVGAFELFPDSGRIAVSEEFCRLWGLPLQPEYELGRLFELVEPEDALRIRTNRAEVDNEILDYIEYRIHRASDGALRWMARRGEVITDEAGHKRFLGVSYDITDRKKAELALQALNANLEFQVAERTAERDRMWRLSTDVMMVSDFEANIVAVNPAWNSTFGWDEADMIGRRFIDLVHPDDVAATLAEVGKLSAGETTLRFENRYPGKDGEYRWLSWTAVPDEGFIHAVGRDVTAEKAKAAELEQAQAALRQAQKMEAVGQLTGGIAHDFNNLLTGVLGSLDLLTRRLQQGRIGELDRYVTAAATSASRAAALTQRLLAFSRRQPLDPKPVDANRLLRGMDELLRRTIGESIELEFVAAGGLWTIRCDPHQLESAILNLAINSRDAMPQGGALTIETCNVRLDDAYAHERQVSPGQYVCISVTDTGTGIPREIIERVVEPFFTTKPIGQGTGLGLSMIYGFAQQSEGHLKIYSEVGQGTTVKLYLPRFYGEAEDSVEDVRAALPEGRARQEVVLIVEDENAVRDVVTEVLAELGCRTIEAIDGPSGLQILQSDARIDLLLTDVGLPGLNGRQLADAARALRPGLKVLFMTGYAESATIASGFLEPGMQMITKPFPVEALTARVQEMLGGG